MLRLDHKILSAIMLFAMRLVGPELRLDHKILSAIISPMLYVKPVKLRLQGDSVLSFTDE